MKKVSLLFCIMLQVSTLMANQIDIEQAKGIAVKFMQNRNPNAQIEKSSQALTQTINKKGNTKTPAYYIFNTSNDEGFVIVSANDRTDAILGYATNGTFDTNEMPENIKEWMQGYAEQIALLNSRAEIPTPYIINQPAISPLLSTKWNQDAPYNHLCPLQGNYHTYTGCTATALAQAMKYHEWPKEQTKDIPAYTTKSEQIYVSELPSTLFQWNEMQDEYNYTDDAPEVTELMRYCGQALQSDFNRYSTSAYLIDIPEVLKTYFGYYTTQLGEIHYFNTNSDMTALQTTPVTRTANNTIYKLNGTKSNYFTKGNIYIVNGQKIFINN